MPTSQPPERTRLPSRAPAAYAGGFVCLSSVRVGMPEISEGRLARIPIHLAAHDGLRTSFELQWRYPPDTFSPEMPEASLQNLFTLAALVPLLNYLPFSASVTVDGPLEPSDAEWLNRLASATCREIQRLKLTPDNPFLRPELLEIGKAPALRPPVFEANVARLAPLPAQPQERRAAVIHDGSPESLLTWAILNELKADPLGIFYNHAMHGLGAAANAWSQIQRQSPAPPLPIWTNLTLLFDFLLRHLDFLRPNYQTIHTDLTPLRIFEFEAGVISALPLLLRHNVAHIVLPHRSETAERRHFSGTLMAQPPFEQTRAFDDLMTVFFGRKGWNVQQWTLLRPTSPLVIQRALHDRYPEYFRLQVACLRPRLEMPPPSTRLDISEDIHGGAPNEESLSDAPYSAESAESQSDDEQESERDENTADYQRRHRDLIAEGGNAPIAVNGITDCAPRAIPCGACESCRRLVVILVALGIDPAPLGYGPAKAERALAHTWRVSTLPPEARVQRHVLHLLEKAGMPGRLSAARKSAARDEAQGQSMAPKPPRAVQFEAIGAEAGSDSPQPFLSQPNAPARFEPCPEVEALRFDSTRVFVDTIPLEFRRPIYEILLRHSSGAMRRDARGWTAFELLNDQEMTQPRRLRDSDFMP